MTTTPDHQKTPLEPDPPLIASFLGWETVLVLRRVVAGEDVRAQEMKEFGLFRSEHEFGELVSLRLFEEDRPTALGHAVAAHLSSSKGPKPPPGPLVVPVSIHIDTVLSLLGHALPLESAGIDWCTLEGWHLPAGADVSWATDYCPVLSSEAAKLRASYGLDPSDYIHEAALAPLLGGHLDVRITGPCGLLWADRVATIGRRAVERGLTSMSLQHEPLQVGTGDWLEATFSLGNEFLQHCVFGKVLFPIPSAREGTNGTEPDAPEDEPDEGKET